MSRYSPRHIKNKAKIAKCVRYVVRGIRYLAQQYHHDHIIITLPITLRTKCKHMVLRQLTPRQLTPRQLTPRQLTPYVITSI